MISRILMCTAVVAATVAVILLSVFKPGGSKGTHQPKPSPNNPISSNQPAIITLYVQPAPPGSSVNADTKLDPSAIQIAVFDQPLTEGPENTSKVIGRAQGFMLPTSLFATSAFNVFNLNINTSEYKGSVSIQGKQHKHQQEREELPVVGGTGYFAFATGFAVFTLPNVDSAHHGASKPLYHVKLHLRYRDGE
ncbi:hypothetical protein SUGI_0790000 [Cryptomeria japonica]|uniref:dirigent protein 2 n=1 Tax=Cryptomeria japonica TaxID=3369 RepID=UPI0024148C1F|nr:dirigent protein 2 [Cryptomeria japonica]GLJ38747.1 hypothetical protein SUGI_0790000 [Cryptomeria japonica]